MIARTDATRGVWKAPAGMEADLRGVTAPLHAITSQETAALNPVGVNALRELPGGGLVVWGARTRSSDPEWRYVPVRRMALMIEESMHAGTQWVVTEPNEEALWAQVRSATEAFMLDLWRRGALQGTRPDDAFFVRCGLGSTMTTADIAAGRLNIIVGFAPLRPAEFVVLRITKQLPVP